MRFKFCLKSLQLLFVLYGSVVPDFPAVLRWAGVPLVFRSVPLLFRCSATVLGCFAVLQVFCVLLFRFPAFLVL